MPVSSILAITQLASNQAQAFTVTNEAVTALEQASNAALDLDLLSANKTISITEMTRNVLFRLKNNTVARTVTFPARLLDPADSATPYTKRLVVVHNTGSATATISINTTGPTTITMAADEKALVYLEASSSAGVVTKLLSSTGAGGGGGGVFTLGAFVPGALTVGSLVRYVVAEAITLADDVTGSYGSVVTPPSSAQALEVYRNATQIGTVSISTGGVFTFSTSGTGNEVFAPGDVMSVRCTTVVGGITDLALTLKGTR